MLTRGRSLEPSSKPSTQVPHVYVGRCGWQPSWRPTIVSSTSYLLAPLLYWLCPPKVSFYQTRFKDDLQNTKSYASRCPVRHFLHHILCTFHHGWIATRKMLPSKPSQSNAWPPISPHFVPASIPQRYQNICYGAPSLWLYGLRLARCLLMSVVGGLDLNVMHRPPLPLICRMCTKFRGL